MNPEWKRITFGDLLTLAAPEDVLRADVQGIDSEVAEWKANEITIRIDYGLFSDRLTSYADRKGYLEREAQISGLPAHLVEFEEADGSLFVGAHFFDLSTLGVSPRSLTLVVRVVDPSTREVARRIVRSVEFEDRAK